MMSEDARLYLNRVIDARKRLGITGYPVLDQLAEMQAEVAAFNARQTRYHAVSEVFSHGLEWGVGIQDKETGWVHAVRTVVPGADAARECIQAALDVAAEQNDGASA